MRKRIYCSLYLWLLAVVILIAQQGYSHASIYKDYSFAIIPAYVNAEIEGFEKFGVEKNDLKQFYGISATLVSRKSGISFWPIPYLIDYRGRYLTINEMGFKVGLSLNLGGVFLAQGGFLIGLPEVKGGHIKGSYESTYGERVDTLFRWERQRPETALGDYLQASLLFNSIGFSISRIFTQYWIQGDYTYTTNYGGTLYTEIERDTSLHIEYTRWEFAIIFLF